MWALSITPPGGKAAENGAAPFAAIPVKLGTRTVGPLNSMALGLVLLGRNARWAPPVPLLLDLIDVVLWERFSIDALVDNT